jgi:hypothetical protein
MKNSLFQKKITLHENEHRNINIESAASLADKLSVKPEHKFSELHQRFYQRSGLNFIFNRLISKDLIKKNLKFLFIENSNMPSALLNNELDAFSLTWEDNNLDYFRHNVSQWFKPVILALQKTNTAIFWHREFFHEPRDGHAILTYCDSDDNNPLEGRTKLQEKFKEVFNEIRKNKHINNKVATIAAEDNDKTPFSYCYDEKNLTVVNLALGKIPFDFNKFKHSVSGDKSTEAKTDVPASLLHTLNHLFYDIFLKGKVCLPGKEYGENKDQFFLDVIRSGLDIENSENDLIDLSKNPVRGKHRISNFCANEIFPECDDTVCCNKTDTVFLSIPVLCANPIEDGRFVDSTLSGFGALFVYAGIKKNSSDKLKIIKEFEEFSKEITTHLRSFSQGYVFSLNKNIELIAIRAAISQVMARNLSHNIGSHVMNKLIDGEDLRDKILNEFFQKDNDALDKNITYNGSFKLDTNDSKIVSKRLCELIDCDSFGDLDDSQRENINKLEIKIEDNSENESKTHNQIAIFNNYLKCRMDYISDITFGTPLMQTNKYIRKELFKDFDKVKLLLESISGLSNFKYSIKFLYEGIEIEDSKDRKIAIPNDVLGCQAFYNILENIIRNTAKHQIISNDSPVIFSVNFRSINQLNDLKGASQILKEEANHYYCVEIYDNCKISGYRDIGEESDEIQNHFESISKIVNEENGKKEIDAIEWLVYNQNKKLNKSLLKSNRQLRATSLGLIEMGASASYLRKVDVLSVEEAQYYVDLKEEKIFNNYEGINNLNILKAFKHPIGDEYSLGYRFFVHKPEEILFVLSEYGNEDRIKELRKEGIWIIRFVEFQKYLDNGGVYNHQLMIFHNTKQEASDNGELSIENYISKYKTSLPIRVLNIKYNQIDSILKKEISEIEKEVWTLWKSQFLQNYNITQVKITNINPKKKEDKTFIAILSNHDNKINLLLQENKELNFDYFEPLSSKAQQQLPGFYKNGMNNFPAYFREIRKSTGFILSYLKLKESFLSRILVIDERIQDEYKKLVSEKIPLSYTELNKMVGIYCPNPIEDFNLSDKQFDDIMISKIRKYIDHTLGDKEDKYTQYDFLLIHYSILERMFSSNISEINNYMEEALIDKVNVVVTSGRGTPEGLSRKVRFINLSPVINTFINIRSKYQVHYLLNSSRKSNRL